jgi:hypothetical protein
MRAPLDCVATDDLAEDAVGTVQRPQLTVLELADALVPCDFDEPEA